VVQSSRTHCSNSRSRATIVTLFGEGTGPPNKELKLTKPGELWRLRSLTPVFDGQCRRSRERADLPAASRS
jgi:hypothetical protein